MDLLKYDKKDGRLYYSLKEVCAHLNRLFDLPIQYTIFPSNLSSDKKNGYIDWNDANKITEKEYLNITGFCYLRYYLCVHPRRLKEIKEELTKIGNQLLEKKIDEKESDRYIRLIGLWDLKM